MGAQAKTGATTVPPIAAVLSEAELATLERGIEMAAGGWFPEFAAVVQRLAEANAHALLAAEDAMGGHPAMRVAMEAANELVAAIGQHDAMATPHHGYAVILEELDELWEGVKSNAGRGLQARKEALQVAAMGMRYVLDLCGPEGGSGA